MFYLSEREGLWNYACLLSGDCLSLLIAHRVYTSRSKSCLIRTHKIFNSHISNIWGIQSGNCHRKNLLNYQNIQGVKKFWNFQDARNFWNFQDARNYEDCQSSRGIDNQQYATLGKSTKIDNQPKTQQRYAAMDNQLHDILQVKFCA